MNDYELLDSGKGRKLERFGPYVISRPASQAIWEPTLDSKTWNSADGVFTREQKEGCWLTLPKKTAWEVDVSGIQFHISPTDFGHLGIFPEQAKMWTWIIETIHNEKTKRKKEIKALNLFAYSGGSTFACAKGGASVCHLDASPPIVALARENCLLNDLPKHPIRWIVDDVMKFLKREERRGSRYDAIILDPPSFGRGTKGELFKIEEDLIKLLKQINILLSADPLFVLLSCHTPGITPLTLHHVLAQTLPREGAIQMGEMVLEGKEALPLPSGTFARWFVK